MLDWFVKRASIRAIFDASLMALLPMALPATMPSLNASAWRTAAPRMTRDNQDWSEF